MDRDPSGANDMQPKDHAYVVRGRWPFPLDMLRRDGSRAATPTDQGIIDRLSGEEVVEESDIDVGVEVSLVIPEAGIWRPNVERWASFDWEVVDGDAMRVEREALAAEREATARRKELLASGAAKLTPEERGAFEWYMGRVLP